MKRYLLKGTVAAALFLAALLPLSAGAAQFNGDKSGSTSVNNDVNDDLYAGGSTVTINSQVSGDAVLAGGTVMANSTVGESLLAAGGTVTITGNVSDDIRVLGGTVVVNGNVSHDAIVLGGQVIISSSAVIGKDLVVLAGTVTVDGLVKGNVFVRGGNVTINAPVSGSVDIKADTVTFGPKAAIGGKLVYASPSETEIANGMVLGGVQYSKTINKKTSEPKGSFAGLAAIGIVFKLIIVFAIAWVFTTIFKKRSLEIVQSTMKGFGWKLIYGFSAMIAVPMAALIVLVTVVGAPVSVIVMCIYAIAFSLSGIFAPVVIGAWIWKAFKKTGEYPVNVYSVLVGSIISAIAGLIPFFGWAFNLVFALAVFGALSREVIVALQNEAKR
jgi:cytoskeletal protein CcmA (bactofilin family)